MFTAGTQEEMVIGVDLDQPIAVLLVLGVIAIAVSLIGTNPVNPAGTLAAGVRIIFGVAGFVMAGIATLLLFRINSSKSVMELPSRPPQSEALAQVNATPPDLPRPILAAELEGGDPKPLSDEYFIDLATRLQWVSRPEDSVRLSDHTESETEEQACA